MAGRELNEWTTVSFDEIEAWRRLCGLSKLKAASLIGISNSCYHNWQRGTNAPNPSTQQRIREMLDARSVSAAEWPVGSRISYPLVDASADASSNLRQRLAIAKQALTNGRRSSPSLERAPISAPYTGKEASTMDDPSRLSKAPDYLHYGADFARSFQMATDDEIRVVVLRLTSAALKAGMKVGAHDLPTLVRGLRLALT